MGATLCLESSGNKKKMPKGGLAEMRPRSEMMPSRWFWSAKQKDQFGNGKTVKGGTKGRRFETKGGKTSLLAFEAKREPGDHETADVPCAAKTGCFLKGGEGEGSDDLPWREKQHHN